MKENKQGPLLIKILVKALEAVKVRGKLPFFKIPVIYLSFLAKHILLKDSSNTSLYYTQLY